MESIKQLTKKANFLASHVKNNERLLAIEKTSGTRYFVSERLYQNKKDNFLSKLTTAGFREVDAVLKKNSDQIKLYEVINHTAIKHPKNFKPTKYDFILPEIREKGSGNFCFDQEHCKFINCTFPTLLQKTIVSEINETVQNSGVYRLSYATNFLTQAEKDIEKLLTKDFTKEIQVSEYQESYFLYDQNNIAKTSFVNKINRFLPMFCSFSFFGSTETEQLQLISPKNAQSFYVEKSTLKKEIDLQIVHVSGEDLITKDKKLHEILITKINKNKNIKVIDFLLIRGQQGFEEGKEINPIDIKIENNRIQNVFDKFQCNKIRFKLNGILFVSSIKNDTEKIFLQTTGLSDAKYAITNDSYKQIIGIINFSDIQIWSEIKMTSKWVNANFQEQRDNRNT